MSAGIVNLRRARKAKARTEREQEAASRRTAFGRSKAEKAKTGALNAQAERQIEGHRLKPQDE
jgi:hypothetical protein